MQITFLGTGTSQGIPIINCDCKVCHSQHTEDKRLRCSVLIDLGDKNFIIDVGPDFRQQMLRAKVKKLNGVLITHEHNDHIIGLDDIRPFNFSQKEEMKLFASDQVLKDLAIRFQYIFEEAPYPGAPRVSIQRIKNEAFKIGGTTVIPIEVKHGQMDVLGFRINDFTYITDANFIEESEKDKIRGSKILVLNALQKFPHHSHFNLAEAIEMIEELKPDKAYLTHISHRMGSHHDTSMELPKNVFLAYDGLQLDLP